MRAIRRLLGRCEASLSIGRSRSEELEHSLCETMESVPPWSLTRSDAKLRPMPVPSVERPSEETRWKRSTTLSMSAFGMPTPV